MAGMGRPGWAVVAVIAALLAVVGIVSLARPEAATPSPPPVAESLADACRLPASDAKAGGSLSWRPVVRMDSRQQAVALFLSGYARLLCIADRAPDGSFGSVLTSMGGDPADTGAKGALTDETGMTAPDGGPDQADLIVGRMPPATASIDVVTSDGEHRNAALGDGWYMAYAITSESETIVEIAARDAGGAVIARLAAPSGVQPGASATR